MQIEPPYRRPKKTLPFNRDIYDFLVALEECRKVFLNEIRKKGRRRKLTQTLFPFAGLLERVGLGHT